MKEEDVLALVRALCAFYGDPVTDEDIACVLAQVKLQYKIKLPGEK